MGPSETPVLLLRSRTMTSTPDHQSASAVPEGVSGAVLELKLISEIAGTFRVARYQRGYRWGQLEVQQLLDDIWQSKGTPYNLQPVVVKREGENAWELVDGQQRLTTLYLIFRFMEREQLKRVRPPYSITYDTRPGSEAYLQEPDADRAGENIDFFHLHTAYECIRAWFEKEGSRQQYVADKFYGYLFESVRVIWYEAPVALDSTTLFTRLNVGRIPLTDAELFRALLLSRSRGGEGRTDRSLQIAAQWDVIERELHEPDVWSFVTGEQADEHPTRINLLLDTLVGGPLGRARPRFHTFEELRQRMDKRTPQEVWEDVVALHAQVLGWFEDRDSYHKIGYLVAAGQITLGDLVALAHGQPKSGFQALLDRRIRETLGLAASDLMTLSYETDAQREKCERLLLLMNVETVRRLKNSSERYSFHIHRRDAWSLEHIHAQNAEPLNKSEQWKEWLRLHREALVGLPVSASREALLARIDGVGDQLDRQVFLDLARVVTSELSLAATPASAALHSVHSVTNLTLLASNHNSALSNAVFEVKRRRILELDRRGEYIPVCTRQVFLKYYTDADAQQVHFWSERDRNSYLKAILSEECGVGRYLGPEVRQS